MAVFTASGKALDGRPRTAAWTPIIPSPRRPDLTLPRAMPHVLTSRMGRSQSDSALSRHNPTPASSMRRSQSDSSLSPMQCASARPTSNAAQLWKVLVPAHTRRQFSAPTTVGCYDLATHRGQRVPLHVAPEGFVDLSVVHTLAGLLIGRGVRPDGVVSVLNATYEPIRLRVMPTSTQGGAPQYHRVDSSTHIG